MKILEKKNLDIKKQIGDNAADARKQRETATSKLKEEMVTKLQKKDEQIAYLETKMDDLGGPKEEVVIKLAQSLNIDLREEDIDIVHRFKKRYGAAETNTNTADQYRRRGETTKYKF